MCVPIYRVSSIEFKFRVSSLNSVFKNRDSTLDIWAPSDIGDELGQLLGRVTVKKD